MPVSDLASRLRNTARETVGWQLLDDQSTDETTSDAVDILDYDKITMLVESASGVTGGVVTLEAARTSDYSGTWQSLGTLTTNAGSQTFALNVGPANDVGDAGLPLPFVRARISTAISGGASPSVDVYLYAQR